MCVAFHAMEGHTCFCLRYCAAGFNAHRVRVELKSSFFGSFFLSRKKEHPPAYTRHLCGTCQIFSAYSATERSAAKMPLRAMLWRLMRFQVMGSA